MPCNNELAETGFLPKEDSSKLVKPVIFMTHVLIEKVKFR
jgi:hypothetical protein